MHNDRLDALPPSPFYRQIPALFGPLAPPAGLEPIDMTLGDPRHAPPEFVGRILAANVAGLGRYQPTAGTQAFKQAVAAYLARRYGLPDGMIDAERHVTHLSGTREGLFMVAQAIVPERVNGQRPAILLPNPFYPTYAGAAMCGGAEAIYVPATRENGFLPDFRAVDPAVLARTAAIYFCSPANPQGVCADLDYLKDLVGLARELGCTLVMDECYADIYDRAPPDGVLQACQALGGGLESIIAFHSLSKRSSLPGLRSGFAVGDPVLIDRFRRLREYAAVAPPPTTAAVAIECWTDEAHVAANRELYRRKFDAAEQHLAGRHGFYRPPGGFFLWLDVGDGERAAARLWTEAAVKVVPGRYLTRPDADGTNHGAPYIRVALVPEPEITGEALRRIAVALG